MIVTLKRLSYVKESYCALTGIVHPLSSSCVSNVFCVSMADYCPVHKRLLLRQKPFLFCSASLRIIETAFPEMMVIYHFEEKVICHFEKIIIYHIVVSNRHFVPTSDNSKGHSFRNLISNRKSYIKLYPLKVSSCRVLFSHFENNTDRADLHICRLPLGEKALTPIPSIHLYSPSTRLLGGDF